MNPATGTFISMDSYQGSMYDPVSLHKYLYANAETVKYVAPSGYTSVSEFSVASAMQSALNGIKNLNNLTRLVQWANAVCTIYDTATEMMNVIFNDGSVVDLFVALLKGVVVGFMCDGMCKAGLGFILKPVMAVFGVNTQVNELQEAIHEGDPTKIAVKTVELICIIFGLTRQCFTARNRYERSS